MIEKDQPSNARVWTKEEVKALEKRMRDAYLQRRLEERKLLREKHRNEDPPRQPRRAVI